MRKKFLTITFFCVGCGILITGCSSGYKIKPASVNQTGYGWEWDWSNGCGDYIEGTYYGEVTTFFVIGFIFRGNKYFL